MGSDLYRFKITEHTSDPDAQLAIDWSGIKFGPNALAKRLRVVLRGATYESSVWLLRETLRVMSPAARRAAIITPVAKVAAYELPQLAAALGLPLDRKGAKTSPASLDAMAASLAGLDGAAFAAVLEGFWSRPSAGYISPELWLLHMLLHQLDPEGVAAPRTTRVSLAVEAIHPDVKMPSSTGGEAQNLALRMLGFMALGGPIDARTRGGDIPQPLDLPFSAVLTERKARSGSLHVLSTTEALAPYTAGLEGTTTAWG